MQGCLPFRCTWSNVQSTSCPFLLVHFSQLRPINFCSARFARGRRTEWPQIAPADRPHRTCACGNLRSARTRREGGAFRRSHRQTAAGGGRSGLCARDSFFWTERRSAVWSLRRLQRVDDRLCFISLVLTCFSFHSITRSLDLPLVGALWLAGEPEVRQPIVPLLDSRLPSAGRMLIRCGERTVDGRSGRSAA